jgi:hypothetical protein
MAPRKKAKFVPTGHKRGPKPGRGEPVAAPLCKCDRPIVLVQDDKCVKCGKRVKGLA